MRAIQVSVERPGSKANVGDVVVLTISGELGITAMVGPDAKHTGTEGDTALYQALKEALPASAKRVIIDISGVTYLSSLGMGALLRFQDQVKESGGEMRLAAPTDLIGALLHRCRLDHAFKIFPDVAAAVMA